MEREIEMETRERDLERLIPMHNKSGASPRDVVLSVPPSPLASPIHVAGREVSISLSPFFLQVFCMICVSCCV